MPMRDAEAFVAFVASAFKSQEHHRSSVDSDSESDSIADGNLYSPSSVTSLIRPIFAKKNTHSNMVQWQPQRAKVGSVLHTFTNGSHPRSSSP